MREWQKSSLGRDWLLSDFKNQKGLRTESLNYGIKATIDPCSQKEHAKIHKIPKFGVNQACFD